MVHFFKNNKVKQFDEAYAQCNEAYNLIADDPDLRDITNDFKQDLDTLTITYACQTYTNKAHAWQQRLQHLDDKTAQLEPQTDQQDGQKVQLRLEINRRINDLLTFTAWLYVVQIAYEEGRTSGLQKVLHDAEENTMD